MAFEKQRKRKRRKKTRRRRLLIIIATIMLAVGAYAISPYSRITIVNVYDNEVLTQDQIIELSGLIPEKSTYTFMQKWLLEARIEKSPFISSVEITRKKGRQVDLHIVERQVVFKTIKGDKLYAYFADGASVEVENNMQISATTLQTVAAQDTFPYEQLAKDLGVVPKEITSKISEIVHEPSELDANRFRFYMDDGNRIIILLQNITTHLKHYEGLVKMVGDEKWEFIIEYAGERVVVGKRIPTGE